jgi:hypothetical protein
VIATSPFAAQRFSALVRRTLPLFAAFLALTPAGARAKAIHLDVPEELRAETDDLAVSARKRLFLPKRPADRAVVFGSFQVMQYRAGWTETTRYGVGSRSLLAYKEKSWRKYSFELQNEGGGRLPVECVQRKEERGLSVLGSSRQTDFDVPWGQELHCSLYPGDGVVWELDVTPGSGTLAGPEGTAYRVRASNRAEGTRFRLPTPVGFLFEREGKAVGAVEVLNKGRFLFSRSLAPDDRNLVAAAAGALLLADSLE